MFPDSQARTGSGFFSRLKQRLNKGKAWLKTDLPGLFKRPIDADTLEALEEQLLLADVGVEATQWLIDRLRRVGRGDDRGGVLEHLREAVLELLQPLEVPLDVSGAKPFVVLAIGVNGTGKTTTIGKLAFRLRGENRSVLLAAGDTFRAAAVEQLQRWAERAHATLIAQATGADPAAVVHDALESARARGTDVVIADTAGRLHTASGLMDELQKIKRVVRRFDSAAPHETLLVLDASQGQNALAQALEFNRRLGVTGLCITKLDGTAKGGIVLAIARKLALPIRFIAIGEGIEDFAPFSAREFTDALLGSETR